MYKCKKCGIEKSLKEFYKKGKYYKRTCKDCCNALRRKNTENTGRFKKGIVPWNKGKKLTDEQKKNYVIRKGWHHTEEVKRKMSLTRRIGKSRYSWNYKEWRQKVFERDGNKCMKCGNTEKLHPHHIVSWEKSEELRFELSNGVTLCSSCHSKEQWKTRERTSWNKGKKMTKPAWNKGLKKCMT